MGSNTTLATILRKGRELARGRGEAVETHQEFEFWDEDVAKWLGKCYPQRRFEAEWSALGGSKLVVAGEKDAGIISWNNFFLMVKKRLNWLAVHCGDNAEKSIDEGRTRETGNKRVFLVHGHNEAAREKVARFLERVGLQPVILHEQPNKGRTIIEKFEAYSDASFAVVLLTGDDVGKARETASESLTPRARQNVILELGYFLGKLGRDRVCPLCEDGLETPSDYDGVVYVPLDEHGAWQMRLASELREAQLPLDLDRVFGPESGS